MIFDLHESETEKGWLFSGEATVSGKVSSVEMLVSWADYEYWGRGLVRPVDVARAILKVVGRASDLAGLPRRFDAARFRRSIRGFDDQIRLELGFEELDS